MAVAIYTTRGNDVALAITGFLLGGVSLWSGFVGVWNVTPADLHGVRGEALALLVLNIFGPLGMALVVGIFGVWLSCLGVGGIWRLVKRSPAAVADDRGIRFHPSIGPELVQWTDVHSICWIKRAPGEIEITLAFRTWSFWNWATSKRIRLNHVAIGLSWREAASIVRAMRQAQGF